MPGIFIFNFQTRVARFRTLIWHPNGPVVWGNLPNLNVQISSASFKFKVQSFNASFKFICSTCIFDFVFLTGTTSLRQFASAWGSLPQWCVSEAACFIISGSCSLIFDSRIQLHCQHELLSSEADAVQKIAQAVRATMADCLKRHCNCCCVCCSRLFLYLFWIVKQSTLIWHG